MNFEVCCPICNATGWVRGYDEPDTNVAVLYDSDTRLGEICDHILHSGDYDMTGRVEYDDEL